MPSPLLLLAAIAAYAISTIVVADIIRATITHYSRGNDYHLDPLPLHHAFIVAVVEVCWDRPLAFHQSRMSVVNASEARRIEAREAAMRRHPASQRARQECQANHPSALRATTAYQPTSTPA